MGIQRIVFNKPAELSYTDTGVKKKTFKIWKHFRAGVEGNISELKRACGVGRALGSTRMASPPLSGHQHCATS